MSPDNEPVTKADLNALHTEMQGIHSLLQNELRHLREDVNENTAWRQEFTRENGPWRKMDKRMQAQEQFSESMIKTVGRISNLFYTVLGAVLIWAIIGIITNLPKLAALLGTS